MIETLIYFILGFFILRAVLSMFVFENDEEVEERSEDIREHLERQRVAHIQIKLEEHNGWWYGFYHTNEGAEIFVAQGTTYTEAVDNCKERLKDNAVLRNLKIEFKEA